jgi:lipoyl(octanoyl) transferase
MLDPQMERTEHGKIHVENWGEVSYREALSRQQEYVDQISRELRRETLVFCSHPPVVTLGRGTKEGDVFAWTGETFEVSRGGRATYHGPSQTVVYPILDLNPRGRDLHKFMRNLEDAMLEVLSSFGIEAVANAMQIEDGAADATPATGAWIDSKKIGSIGIAVRRWISYHGLALNIEHDPHAFEGMKPCGFSPGSVISMEEVLGQRPARSTVESRLEMALLRRLSI